MMDRWVACVARLQGLDGGSKEYRAMGAKEKDSSRKGEKRPVVESAEKHKTNGGNF